MVVFIGSATTPDIRVAEYSGFNTLDVTAAAGGSGTTNNSGSATTTVANELLFAADDTIYGPTTAGSGYTSRMVTADGDIVEDEIVSATGSYSGASTEMWGSDWVMQLATFYSGSGNTQATLYASPGGSGSQCTSATPCTLSTALSKVASLAPAMTGDIYVQLAGGTYALTAPLTLTSAHSGTNGHMVVIRAETGQQPIISGGLAITGWTLHDANLNIWSAAVPTGYVTRQIYVNGNVAQLAAQSAAVLGTMTPTATGYTITNSAVASWTNVTDLDFDYPGGGVTQSMSFTDEECPVASISGTTVTMQQPCFSGTW